MQKMDFSSVLDSFGIPLTVRVIPAEKGHYEDGEWVETPVSEWETKEVYEPFIPSEMAAQTPDFVNYGEGGIYEKYEMIWFSKLDVPVKSIVINHEQAYRVEERLPYSDYSNVIQYGVKAVSVFE